MCKVCVCVHHKSVCCLKVRSQVLQQNRKKAAQNHSQQQHKKLEKGNAEVCVCV